MALADKISWNEAGLVCAIVQNPLSGVVLMQAWMNQEALAKTQSSGYATFWSRSRQALWVKGETSGNRQRVTELRLDCDGDTLLVLALPDGPACHTGARDCFFQRAEGDQWQEAAPVSPHELARLEATIAQRATADPAQSYVARLLGMGREKILQKVGEEAVELVLAAAAGDEQRTVSETADLMFHLFVALQEQNISFASVLAELQRREGVSGLVEKAARKES